MTRKMISNTRTRERITRRCTHKHLNSPFFVSTTYFQSPSLVHEVKIYHSFPQGQMVVNYYLFLLYQLAFYFEKTSAC